MATKPAFRQAFAKRRCLIVSDGFYEWQKNGKAKQPFFIHRRDDQPFAFAGLWERWGPERLETCSIVTLPANDFMRPLHDRMPAVLPPSESRQPRNGPTSGGSGHTGLSGLAGQSDLTP